MLDEGPEQPIGKTPVPPRKITAILVMACLFKPSCFSKRRRKKENGGSEHNRAWLLAESATESKSLNSSFRFSICTPLDLQSGIPNSSSSSAVLMQCKKLLPLENTVSPLPSFLIRFSLGDLADATDCFSEERLLGRGALSYVYRGKLGFLRTAVAVKRLDKQDKETPKAFCRELMIASSLRHRHVVPLMGYCIEPEGLFLVYRYVSGGNLERHLHGNGRKKLPWRVRYKVALGVAKAIGYLHKGTEKCVVHRDIKPSNILLTSRKTPKLCDFGLATWTASASSPFLCKTVKGTFGYLAPEYFEHGKVSEKTDVYAYGVVLLELITGRKAIEVGRGAGEENLVAWAKGVMGKGRGAIEDAVEGGRREEVGRMIAAAEACVREDEGRRPDMEEVLGLLRGEGRRRKPNFSGILDCYSQPMVDYRKAMNDHLALAMLGVGDFEEDHVASAR